jgi:hypothetical protein
MGHFAAWGIFPHVAVCQARQQCRYHAQRPIITGLDVILPPGKLRIFFKMLGILFKIMIILFKSSRISGAE